MSMSESKLKKCVICGNLYTPNSGAQKYCFSCKNKAYKDVNQEWQKEHKSQKATYLRNWRKRNKTKVAASNKKYYIKNKEYILEHHKKYIEENRDLINEYYREYRLKQKIKKICPPNCDNCPHADCMM